jgi:hypothetical protein
MTSANDPRGGVAGASKPEAADATTDRADQEKTIPA